MSSGVEGAANEPQPSAASPDEAAGRGRGEGEGMVSDASMTMDGGVQAAGAAN